MEDILEIVSQEVIEGKIFMIRRHRVMLDRDLAALYGVETSNLNKAVKRNADRFPEDFMFQLTNEEFKNLMFQNGISRWGGTRKLPYVFTENGVSMLSSVLNSQRAIHVNIQIMRTFTKLREMLLAHKDLTKRLDDQERKYDAQFRGIFDAIRQLMTPPSETKKRKIGFRREIDE
jgi:flagellar capping protein FliD